MIIFQTNISSKELPAGSLQDFKGNYIKIDKHLSSFEGFQEIIDSYQQIFEKSGVKVIVSFGDLIESAEGRGCYERISFFKARIIECDIEDFKKYNPKIEPNNLILSHTIVSCEGKSFREAVTAALRKTFYYQAKFHKITASIDNYSDLDYLLHIGDDYENMIFVGTGLLGKLFEILKLFQQRQISYVRLPDQRDYWEQLTLDEFERFRPKAGVNSYSFGGIIGGIGVYNSLGLKFYNEMFTARNLPAVYLPFPVNEEDDFFKWLNKFAEKKLLFGFSVTMPLKTKISKHFSISYKVINLISINNERDGRGGGQLPYGKPQYFYNTDYDAVVESLKIIGAKKQDSFLIYGYGGIAETVVLALKDYPKVYISGRDNAKGRRLAGSSDRSYVPATDIATGSFDVLINCTPVGMSGEDLLDILGIKPPMKVIDIPYGKQETPLITNCRRSKKPYVSGDIFWSLQAEKQQEIFISNLQ